MKVLVPALLMSAMASGSATAFAQLPCDACQVATALPSPSAYYYPVPYAVPTYAYAPPTVCYVPVPYAVPTEVPLAPQPIPDAIPALTAIPSGATSRRVNVYRRIVPASSVRSQSLLLDGGASSRVFSSSQFSQSGVRSTHESLLASGFHLVDSYAKNASIDPAVSELRALRLRGELASLKSQIANTQQGAALKAEVASTVKAEVGKAIKAEAAKVKAPAPKAAVPQAIPALKAAPKKADECAETKQQVEKLAKSLELLRKQIDEQRAHAGDKKKK